MRLTEKHFNGKGYYMRCSENCCHASCDDCEELDKLVDRLGALEDKEERGADAVPVVPGRWISLEPEIGLFECSECGHKILRAECNYCSKCGAKMDGGYEDV